MPPADISEDPVLIAGPLLLGYLLNWGLYGVLCVQVYIYYIAFPNDRIYTKILVYIVFILESIQSIFVAHDAFKAYAKGFNNFDALISQDFTWLDMPVIGGLAAFFVQLFYAYSIRMLGSTKSALLIVVVAIVQCVSAVTAGVLASKEPNLLKLTALHVRVMQGVWAGTSTACDVFISICMFYQLSKRETLFPSTRALVARILGLVIGTGSLTAAVAILNLVLFNVPAIGPAFLAPGALLGKLYSNSMLVVLNSRIDITGRRQNNRTAGVLGRPDALQESFLASPGPLTPQDKGFDIELSTTIPGSWGNSGTKSLPEAHNKHIEIDVTTCKTTEVSS